MRRYIKADLHRIFTRIPRWFLFVIILGVIVFLQFPDDTSDSTTYLSNMCYYMSSMTMILGIIEMIYIYGDDFRSKTMQIAIGSGISRHKIVMAKWFEVMIVSAVDLLLVIIAGMILPVFMVPHVLSGGLLDALINTFMAWLSIVVFYSIVMIVLFLFRGIALALICYILLSSGAIPNIIKLAANLLHFSKFHLQTYTLNSMLDVATARLLLGSIHILSWIGIILYVVVGCILTILIFKKLELDF